MRSSHIVVMLAAAAFLAGSIMASGQMRVFEGSAPESQQDTGEGIPSPMAESRTTGAPAVSIQLDNTGITDWRYLNPRKPQIVCERANDPLCREDREGAAESAARSTAVGERPVIEFVNLTPDRTFEVTTNLALPRTALVPDSLPATVPLVVYDALIKETIDQARPPFRTGETLAAYESRLITQIKGQPKEIVEIFVDVLEVEQALRERAARNSDVSEARKMLVELNLDTIGTNAQQARNALKDAEKQLDEANVKVLKRTGTRDDLIKRRKPLIDRLEMKAAKLQQQRGQAADWEEKQKIGRLLALIEIARDVLVAQSDETTQIVPLRQAIPSIRIGDCTLGAIVTCTAEIQVYPNGSAYFPYEVLLYQADTEGPARFNIRFFEEEETPAKQVAYLVAQRLAGRAGPPKSIGTLAAVASVGVVRDPFIEDRSAKSRNCPFLCEDKPFNGEQRTHYTGAGRIDVTQTLGNLLDGKVSIAFKEGDLGDGTGGGVKLSQYRFNVYSHPGFTFHYGKFTFAAPSAGIAINESGEGFRLTFHNYALARMIKRESSKIVADVTNELDNEVWIAEANNMDFPRFLRRIGLDLPKQPIRTLSLVYLDGDDRKAPETKANDNTKVEEIFFTAHDYRTYGVQVGFTIPLAFTYGTLSAYRSKREADESNASCGSALHVCDGRGDVGLLTITRPFAVGEDGKSQRNVTFSVGLGSGDDPSTSTLDEGYIGETASYSPDQIFLATLAGGISTRKFFDVAQFADADPVKDRMLKEQFHALDIGTVGIGRGLSNKRYLGVKYVENRFSVLEWFARLFGIPKEDIRSKATVITLNDYQLRRPLFDSRNAGQEADIEFQVETPRAVKITIKGGYYWRGNAVSRYIRKDTWTASAGISLSL